MTLAVETTAFLLKLQPGKAAEYRKRHDEIWPEMKAMLLRSGILHYEIWLDAETNTLFAHMITARGADPSARHTDPVMARWREHMKDLLVSDGERPVRKGLDRMFHLSAPEPWPQT